MLLRQTFNKTTALLKRFAATPAKPELSIVVVCFNMRREAARTLYTLSSHYQRGVSEQDYEIIVVDNGSTVPLDKASTEAIGNNISYYSLETQAVSPAAAVNFGASVAQGKYIACIVDGARMVTPNIVYYSLFACRNSAFPYVTTLAWHLGPKEQNQSMLEGYNQRTEDELLNSVDWLSDGYELFTISSQASSSRMAFWAVCLTNPVFFAMMKSQFDDLGGFDERFTSPGGGLVNHAFLNAVVDFKGGEYFVLLGEGSFHQFHGGVATNSKPSEHPMQLFLDEYQRIFNQPYAPHPDFSGQTVCYLGVAPPQSLRFLTKTPLPD